MSSPVMIEPLEGFLFGEDRIIVEERRSAVDP
jgi:hypothetical protein